MGVHRSGHRAVPRPHLKGFSIQYGTRRKQGPSLFTNSEEPISLRRNQTRRTTREPSKDRGHEYRKTDGGHRGVQLISDKAWNTRLSMDLKRSSRDPSDEPERRRRRYSSSPERPRRDYRKKQRSPHQHDREHRSVSPPSRGFEQKVPHKQHESRSRRQRSSSLNRRRQSSRGHRGHRERTKHRSRSPSRPESSSIAAAPPPTKRVRASLPSQQDAFHGKTLTSQQAQDIQPPGDPPQAKEKPNFATSGKLAAETNMVANTSIVLKYNEPPAARLPPASAPWRLYIFKGDSLLETLALHTRSCWLFGRERLVVDCPIDHPSCSKQHAVIQFRFVEVKNEHGDKSGKVKPYIIDLESANGTKVNGDLIPERRYVELKSKDVVSFGESTREYVLVLPPKE